MIQRTLGKTGWQVGVMGFGAWGIGGQWGKVEKNAAINSIRAALDCGVNFFDTADAYGNPPGISEEWVGEALASVRDKVIIATKAGNFARRDGHPLAFTTPLHVELCCEASLHRMKIDCVDLLQCHLAQCTEPDIWFEAFDRLLRKGYIRAFGISTNSIEVVKAFNRRGDCATCQLDYSYLNRSAEADVLPYCQENNIGTIIRGPLDKGIATGKFTRDSKFDDWVRRNWNEGDGRETLHKKLDVVDKVRFLENDGRTLAQAALQFVVTHPAVSVAIPGAKNVDQAQANATAGEALLSDDEYAKVCEATA